MLGLILATFQWMDKTKHRPLIPSFVRLGNGTQKVMFPLIILFVIAMIPSYLASVNNDYYYGSSHILGSGTKLEADTKAIETTFGKNDTYVLLVPKGDTATETELVQELKSIPEVTSLIAFVEQKRWKPSPLLPKKTQIPTPSFLF